MRESQKDSGLNLDLGSKSSFFFLSLLLSCSVTLSCFTLTSSLAVRASAANLAPLDSTNLPILLFYSVPANLLVLPACRSYHKSTKPCFFYFTSRCLRWPSVALPRFFAVLGLACQRHRCFSFCPHCFIFCRLPSLAFCFFFAANIFCRRCTVSHRTVCFRLRVENKNGCKANSK